MKIRPISQQLLVYDDPEINETAAGLLLVNPIKKECKIYTVVAVSNDIEKGLFNAGDKIIVAGYRGDEVTSNGVKYLLINAKDVEAKVYD